MKISKWFSIIRPDGFAYHLFPVKARSAAWKRGQAPFPPAPAPLFLFFAGTRIVPGIRAGSRAHTGFSAFSGLSCGFTL
jgi:hypothetical protein